MISPDLGANLDLKTATRSKFGRNTSRHASMRHSVHMQPWFGFAYFDGRTKFWPVVDVEAWLSVFSHNRTEYLQELLNDPRPEVRGGVERQVRHLMDRGELPEQLRSVIEGAKRVSG